MNNQMIKILNEQKKLIESFNIKVGEEFSGLYLKKDVILLADVVEKFLNLSFEEFDINSLNCVSLSGYTWPSGLLYTDNKLKTLQDEDIILLLGNSFKGGINSAMVDRYVKSDKNKSIQYIDASNIYGHALSQPLLYVEIELDRNVKLEDIINTPMIQILLISFKLI